MWSGRIVDNNTLHSFIIFLVWEFWFHVWKRLHILSITCVIIALIILDVAFLYQDLKYDNIEVFSSQIIPAPQSSKIVKLLTRHSIMYYSLEALHSTKFWTKPDGSRRVRESETNFSFFALIKLSNIWLSRYLMCCSLGGLNSRKFWA